MLPSLADELIKAAQYRPQTADEAAKAKPKPVSLRPERKKMIVDFLTEHRHKTVSAISLHIDASLAHTHDLLRELLQKGKIERAGRGKYQVKTQEEAEA